jgi:hypothetical protein
MIVLVWYLNEPLLLGHADVCGGRAPDAVGLSDKEVAEQGHQHDGTRQLELHSPLVGE